MGAQIKNAEEYILNHPQWNEALTILRHILLETEMGEAIKWGVPVYTVGGKNVAGIAAFKYHVAIWFYHGALLEDKNKVFVNANEGVSKALRKWRFSSVEEIDEILIRKYLEEAIENQKQGKEIKPVRNQPIVIPVELMQAFKEVPNLEKAFKSLTRGNQRMFAHHIAQAKREETRLRRLDKVIPMILEKIGLNDRYRK